MLTNYAGDKETKAQATQDGEKSTRNLDRDSFPVGINLRVCTYQSIFFLYFFTIKK